MGINQLENLVESIKSKIRSLLKKSKGKNKPYAKMDKSASFKVEIRSCQAQKLIDKTLKLADRPPSRDDHTAPEHYHRESYEMFDRWIHNPL